MKVLKSILSAVALFGLAACSEMDNPVDGPVIEPDFQEKQLIVTDFSDWEKLGAKTEETAVEVKAKYSNETITFTLFNTEVLATEDTKFSAYTTLPHMTLRAAKAANPYIQTSPIASVTKVRFVHAATGSNRGWKLEAKGDGDADWVVISDTPANPAGWCEVVADVNRKNVQLRWTNLNASQNAYMFELEICGEVNMAGAPSLGTFKVNGHEYTVGEIFDQNKDGDMEATIEISKAEAMISKENPLTDLVVDYGTVGTITYTATDNSCRVVIPVTAQGQTINYVVNIVLKPDFTLTYIDADGQTELGTQKVEKDAAIKQFAFDESKVTVAESQKFRGWAIANKGSKNRKFTVDDVITEDTRLYALVTDIEKASPNARYEYALNDQYFYAEDHEAFMPVGNGKYHDGQHGWVFGNGDKIDILVGGNANIILGLCQYSGGAAITLTDAAGKEVAKLESDKVTTDGALGTLSYTGEAGTLSINFGGTSYLHKLTIANDAQPLYTYDAATKTYSVEAGKVAGFYSALDRANASGDCTIYLPNGTYDLGNHCLTTISGSNITIKGESQNGTIIQNLPEAEGIGVTATLLNTSNGLTLENLTLKNAYDYYGPTGKGGTGRAVCLQDKGNYTVCKNVTMLSYQDTYYSNNSNGLFYFKDCEIHGVVDFVCGGGDVVYENTLFYLESREITEGKGEVTIAAPNGAKQFGYVMLDCTVDCRASKFNWGRSWGAPSKLAWINTTLKQNLIVDSRFTAAGMNCAADGFFEYGTKDAEGNNITPASNVIKFTHTNGNKEYETILTADQAAGYAKAKVFESAPAEFKSRVGL